MMDNLNRIMQAHARMCSENNIYIYIELQLEEKMTPI